MLFSWINWKIEVLINATGFNIVLQLPAYYNSFGTIYALKIPISGRNCIDSHIEGLVQSPNFTQGLRVCDIEDDDILKIVGIKFILTNGHLLGAIYLNKKKWLRLFSFQSIYVNTLVFFQLVNKIAVGVNFARRNHRLGRQTHNFLSL